MPSLRFTCGSPRRSTRISPSSAAPGSTYAARWRRVSILTAFATACSLGARWRDNPMLRLLADENFNGSIIRGLVRRQPAIDLVRVQDVGLSGADDYVVLAWAAREGWVLLTHDQATVPKYAYERVEAALPMPGVFVGDTHLPVQQAINDILLLVECSEEHEW